MDTRKLVDRELLAAIELFPPLDLDRMPLADLRVEMGAMFPALESLANNDVSLDVVTVPAAGEGPAIEVILHRPRNVADPLPLFLHIHGGGFVLGAAIMASPANIDVARRVGCVVASVEYRLSPHATGPEPVEDCYRALTWLHAHADQFGIDRTRIAIGGESAGAGLSAALALMVRDRHEYQLCLQLLLCPMLDDRTGDNHPFCGEFVWTAPTNRIAWATRIGEYIIANDTSGYIASARAESLEGLPPAYICVGALDLFLEEDLEYARRLARAGVPVEFHVWPGAYHGFELAADAALTRRALDERIAALTRAFS
jgi:acetyl esterase/lipase